MTLPTQESADARTTPAVWTIAAIVAGVAGVLLALVRIQMFFVFAVISITLVLIVLAFLRERKVVALTVAALLAAVAIVLAIALPPSPRVEFQGERTATATPTPLSTTPAPGRPSASPNAGAKGDLPRLGEDSTTAAGVTLTVDTMTCGLKSAGEGATPPVGEYCLVEFTITNDGDQAIDILATDLSGHAAGATFVAVPAIGRLGDDMSTATVLPGVSIEGSLFFDVPEGTHLDTLSISGEWFNGAVDVSSPTVSD